MGRSRRWAFIVSEAAPGREIRDHLVRGWRTSAGIPDPVQSVGQDNLLPLVAISQVWR